jgi:hypothetical protein
LIFDPCEIRFAFRAFNIRVEAIIATFRAKHTASVKEKVLKTKAKKQKENKSQKTEKRAKTKSC